MLSALGLGQGPCQQRVQAGSSRERGARQGWQPAGMAGWPRGVCEQQEPSCGRWQWQGEDGGQTEVAPSAAHLPCPRHHHPYCCAAWPAVAFRDPGGDNMEDRGWLRRGTNMWAGGDASGAAGMPARRGCLGTLG